MQDFKKIGKTANTLANQLKTVLSEIMEQLPDDEKQKVLSEVEKLKKDTDKLNVKLRKI